MRDYRGKREDTQEWAFGAYHNTTYIGYPNGGDSRTTRHYILPQNAGDAHAVVPETVGECTGIFGDFIKGEPKAGDTILRSFIYEGDIVEPVLTEGTHGGFSWGRHVVVFDRGAFCLKNRRGEITPMCNYSVNVKFKVLGNIHDNPELMEVNA